MSWLSSIIPGSPAVWLGVAIWTAVVAWGASRVTQWVTPEPEVPPPDTVYAEGPMGLEDLMEPTMPDRVTIYDTSKTQTQCVQVPTWFAQSQSTTGADSIRHPSVSGAETTPFSWPSTVRAPLTRPSQWAGPNYAITPLMGGSPPLSVGSEQVTLSSYVRGQGRTWTYDVPQDTWGIGLDGSVTAAQQWLQATTTLGVSRMTQWGPIDVTSRLGGGYGALVTEEYRAGPVVRAGLSIEHRW